MCAAIYWNKNVSFKLHGIDPIKLAQRHNFYFLGDVLKNKLCTGPVEDFSPPQVF